VRTVIQWLEPEWVCSVSTKRYLNWCSHFCTVYPWSPNNLSILYWSNAYVAWFPRCWVPRSVCGYILKINFGHSVGGTNVELHAVKCTHPVLSHTMVTDYNLLSDQHLCPITSLDAYICRNIYLLSSLTSQLCHIITDIFCCCVSGAWKLNSPLTTMGCPISPLKLPIPGMGVMCTHLDCTSLDPTDPLLQTASVSAQPIIHNSLTDQHTNLCNVHGT